MADLAANIAAFCGILRRDHDFAIGQSEAHDALRALEAIGVADRARVRSALRLVCCGTRAQTQAFDRAFDAFFGDEPRGVPQASDAPRHTRPGRPKPAAGRPRDANAPEQDDGDADARATSRREIVNDQADAAAQWQQLRARYSPAGAPGATLALDASQAQAMRAAAQLLIRSTRLGRSRRWKPSARDGRFDLRRTIRASFKTGGDPAVLRFQGHPRRNPRFVILIDGSRSMLEHAAGGLAFTAALCEQTARADVFCFSTLLRDVTSDFRGGAQAGVRLTDLGEAWGGGTKIGANLERFIALHAAGVLSPDTIVIVLSDGLDVGDTPQLAWSMREIDRRCAGIVWLNPHAAVPGFTPRSRGMRAALPFITLLSAANDATGFERLARRLMQIPRLRGRRR